MKRQNFTDEDFSVNYEADWGCTVDFGVSHYDGCAGPCCDDGTGPIAYSLVIYPSDSEKRVRFRPAFVLTEGEVESLMNLISNALSGRTYTSISSQKTEDFTCNADTKQQETSFDLIRNVNGQLGEYSLHVVDKGILDILPVNERELQSLLEIFAEMVSDAKGCVARVAARERHARSRMSGKTLAVIVDEVRREGPSLVEDESDLCIVMVLLGAAFFVGPDIDRLVSFTGFPRGFIADIYRRMSDYGLWTGGAVRIGHWFNDELEWNLSGLAKHCIVAEGKYGCTPDEEHGIRHTRKWLN